MNTTVSHRKPLCKKKKKQLMLVSLEEEIERINQTFTAVVVIEKSLHVFACVVLVFAQAFFI